MKRLAKVSISWTPSLAYAIGLITTDGNLSPDGRHINFTTKDKALAITFKKSLNLSNKIGRKARGGSKDKKYYVVQFGDINFYEFLIDLGLTPAKSKTLRSVTIPKKYFFHFLRGCLDGDGNISIFKHPESKHPQFRLRFFSASRLFLEWLLATIAEHADISRGWIRDESRVCVLSFGKEDSIKLLVLIYKQSENLCLERKFTVYQKFLRMWPNW
jgi:hypothetical protein